MASVQKSMRIPKELVEEIQDMAQKSGKNFSTITKNLLEEAIKMHRCPGIAFAEGVSARRARIAGTGIDVWEVIANYNTVGQDLERLSKSTTGSLNCKSGLPWPITGHIPRRLTIL